MPYKGELEGWYVRNHSLVTYITLIALTVWVVLSPNSPIVWRVFPGLPQPPVELAPQLNWRQVKQRA